MKKINRITGALLAVFALVSCAGSQEYGIEAYTEEELADVSNFRILQLTDIHFGLATKFDEEWAYFDKVIEAAKYDEETETTVGLDLIVMTGDMFMNASADVVDRLYDYIDSQGIPWTVAFGNHDRQGSYPPQYVEGQRAYDKYDNCLYVDPDDNINGHGNHYINIVSGDEIVWQVFMLDSGSYHLMGSSYEYEVINEDQIAWYEKVVKETNEAKHGVEFASLTPDQIIPSVAFFHIPLFEYIAAYDAWEASDFDETMGSGVYEDSGIWHGYRNSGFFAKAKELGSTKGIYVGHDHTNNFAVYYQGIQLSYGVKTGRGIYHDAAMIGGQVVVLNDDDTVRVERKFVAY